MKALHVVLPLLITFAVSGCSEQRNESNEELMAKIEKLEVEIEDMQQNLAALEQKTQLSFSVISSNPFLDNAFEDFVFASDEFWKNTVDVGVSECTKRCSADAKGRQATCNALPDGDEKIDCRNDSSNKAKTCNKQC
ncbi:hypothetical protein [Paraglaciecola polaris]|uniref:Lipoprotein n=1 Tax=Paraglaciecola polaris LMG 21857 TaxID=1129793 RepID=K6ZWN0_9ALTE|nr:hypothetical protein [Paraglaciecola polaris]GAC33193.1 hypothetical protein GPLA_2288 [Paraglaciecola polaris LMG 21857]